MLTLEEQFALAELAVLMPPVWDAIERTILHKVEAEAIAEGFSASAVRFLVEEDARALAADRARRLEAATAILQPRTTRLQ